MIVQPTRDIFFTHSPDTFSEELVHTSVRVCVRESAYKRIYCCCVPAMLLLFVAAVVVFCRGSCKNEPLHAYSPGDITIGGLFPVHRQTNRSERHGLLSCSA